MRCRRIGDCSRRAAPKACFRRVRDCLRIRRNQCAIAAHLPSLSHSRSRLLCRLSLIRCCRHGSVVRSLERGATRMRRYLQSDEEKVRMQALVREWQRSSLLEQSQARLMETELQVDLTRTNPFLRALLFLFTALILAASFAFVVVTLDAVSLHGGDDFTMAVVCFVAAPLCFGVAEFLVARFRLYRFGIEEACAVAAVVFLAAGLKFGRSGDEIVYAVASMSALGIFLRFGYVYAAIGAIGCAAAIAFQLGLSGTQERAIAAAILAGIFVIARLSRTEHGIIEAAAWVG